MTDVSAMAVITVAEVHSPFIVQCGGQCTERQLLQTVNTIEQIEGGPLAMIIVNEIVPIPKISFCTWPI